MNYLSVENISKSFGERILFNDVSFGLDKGQKMAFVAKNGSGKTTVLRILAGLDTPDTGEVTFRKGIKVGFLQQDPDLGENISISECIFASDSPVIKAIRFYEEVMDRQDNDKMHEAIEQMDRYAAWDFDSKVKQVLGKLNIHHLDQNVDKLSGGQRKRVALAKVLLEEPDFVIMDEPTNHLDLEMIEWLEEYLTSSGLTIFMVTHDRYFLERVCDEILELDQQQAFRYKGSYSYYLEKRQERYANTAAEVDKAKNLLVKELDWMRRQPKARGTKSKARIDSFYDLKATASQKVKADELKLQVNMNRMGSKILELHHVGKQFGENVLLKDFDYKFARKERIGIVGVNGSGKSTLLNMIMGQEEPSSGKIVVGETIVFGYYSQKGMSFKPGKRVIEIIKDIAEFIPTAKGKDLSAAQMLERFLFPRSQHYQYVEKLSGGEKRRLYLLTILMKNPNFLILDEPTNDLDILTLNVLEEFLLEFQGCLLIVTHDRYFMDKLVDHIFVLEGQGKWRDFPGNYTQYREKKLLEEAIQKEQEKPVKQVPVKEEKPKEKKKKLSFNEKREFEQLEKDLESLELEKEELTEKLNSGTLSNEELQDTGKRLGELMEELEEKEMRWLELSELA